MKITVTGFVASDSVQSNIILFNTIKRFEEDFIRRIPQLKEFGFIAEQQICTVNYSTGNVQYNHVLNENETSLLLTCYYRVTPTIETMTRDLSAQLKSLLMYY